jgi:hypothetical protein
VTLSINEHSRRCTAAWATTRELTRRERNAPI